MPSQYVQSCRIFVQMMTSEHKCCIQFVMGLPLILNQRWQMPWKCSTGTPTPRSDGRRTRRSLHTGKLANGMYCDDAEANSVLRKEVVLLRVKQSWTWLQKLFVKSCSSEKLANFINNYRTWINSCSSVHYCMLQFIKDNRIFYIK